MSRALFLDRDGVINDNKKYVNKPEDLIIYDNAKIALKKAYEKGYILFIVTNQGGVERGHLKEQVLNNIHEKLVDELKDYCKFKEIVFCPDFDSKSKCRKPNPGMIIDLAKKHNINLEKSFMIGDRDTDVTAGINAKTRTCKIGKEDIRADINGDDLLEVVNKILLLDI
ncbi:MAG: D-glycero-alpha-D-manno-heptose-1,7-bisphosphate 7-phosphatase [Clostridiaceae bacterium]